MKKLLLLVFLATWTTTSFAQDWLDDLNAAKTIAAQAEKEILLVFSGSDWCAPCMKLEKEIWESSEFQNYAKDNLVLVKADFPRKKANRLSDYQQTKNNDLAGKYNQQGYFPLVIKMNAKGEVLGKTGYKSLEPKAYIELLESFEN